MFKHKTLYASALLLAGLAMLSPAANAAGTSHTGELTLAPSTMQRPGSISGGAGQATYSTNINNASNINVQTNIDNSKSIDTSSNISVTNTVNGVQVDYGLNGSNSLNVIDNAGVYAAGVASAQQSQRSAAVAEDLEVETLRGSIAGY